MIGQLSRTQLIRLRLIRNQEYSKEKVRSDSPCLKIVAHLLLFVGEILFSVTLVPIRAEKSHAVFGCDVQGIEFPVGFELKVDMRDLTVSLHLANPALFKRLKDKALLETQLPFSSYGGQNKQSVQPSTTIANPTSLSSSAKSSSPAPSSLDPILQLYDQIYPFCTDLPRLDFGDNLAIHSDVSIKIVIRNHSLIPTNFSLEMEQLGAADFDSLGTIFQGGILRLQLAGFCTLSVIVLSIVCRRLRFA